jgi:hypothetical protein
MRIVVWPAHPAMPDGRSLGLKQFLEVSSVLWAVVCLHHGKMEPSVGLSAPNNIGGNVLAEPGVVFDICPPAVDVNEGVEVGPPLRPDVVQVYRVGLHQISGGYGRWSCYRWPVASPPLAAYHQAKSVQYPPHCAQRHICTLLRAVGVDNCGTPSVFSPVVADAVYDRCRYSSSKVVGTKVEQKRYLIDFILSNATLDGEKLQFTLRNRLKRSLHYQKLGNGTR